MTPRWTGFKSPLAEGICQYIDFKRALGRRFATEERALRLLDSFLVEHRVRSIEALSPELFETFLRSRPRTRPKSYNALLGIVRRLLDWLVAHELLSFSPLRVKPRRETAARLPFLFDQATARRLLDAASRIPDGPRAPLRASTYHAVFAILYGLGLRVAEVAHLCCGDVDLDRNVLTVRRGKFGKNRLTRAPEMIALCQQIASIPTKRSARPEIRYLERDEIAALLADVPPHGRWGLRDRALLTFLYNTGARAQEAADLRVSDLDLGLARVRLRGKGDKWRTCPLWRETVRLLSMLLAAAGEGAQDAPVFASFGHRPLTRVGVYRVVCRHARKLEPKVPAGRGRRITPHVLRHTTAVHLLESGVESNVIRAWLGHASLATTDRYAEITIRTKEAALRACELPEAVVGPIPRRAAWRSDPALLKWLQSL